MYLILAHPRYVAQYSNDCYATEISVVGDFAYLLCGISLHILDISNPTSPSLVGIFSKHQHCLNAAVSGNFAYVLTEDNFLHVVDISDPSVPNEVAVLEGTGFYSSLISIVGNYAYLVSPIGSGTEAATVNAIKLRIFDIADPVHLIELGSTDLYGWGENPNSLAIAENLVYVTTSDYYGGLHAFDVSDSAHPHLISVNMTGNNPNDVAIAAGAQEVYVANTWPSKGVRILDIRNPQAPVEIGAYDPPMLGDEIAIAGSHIYFIGGWSVWVVDISNPAFPELAGVYDLPGSGSDIVLVGNYAYVTSNSAGLRVLDVSDLAHITEVGNYPGDFLHLTVAGDYAYVYENAAEGQLDILDISDPHQPVLVGSLEVNRACPISMDNLALHSPYLFVSSSNGLQIVDVANPANPAIVASLSIARCSPILTVGNKLYLGGQDLDGYSAFIILDISDPLHPVQLGTLLYSVNENALLYSIALDGPLAYLGMRSTLFGETGVLALDVSDPTHPDYIAFNNSAYLGHQVVASGLNVYVAGYGLSILRPSLVLAGRVYRRQLSAPGRCFRGVQLWHQYYYRYRWSVCIRWPAAW